MKDQKVRITSIDALRAIVLFGILIVHTGGLFGFLNSDNSFSYFTNIDYFFVKVIDFSLSGRCSAIFSILFGVSFYLILKNPSYGSLKFVWRCFLLMSLGLFVKFFYTYDALMWYGMLGFVLVLFRKLKPLYLFMSFVAVFLLSMYLVKFSIGDLLFEPKASLNRYVSTESLAGIIDYPLSVSVTDYFRTVFNSGVLRTLSYFILGYFFAKVGIVDNLSKYSNLRNVLVFALLYVVSLFLSHVTGTSLFLSFRNLFGAVFYALLFLTLYYWLSKYISFSWLESYGKLGLTNYCAQNICGVIFISTIFIPEQVNFIIILCCSVVFYIIQILFSVIWLRYYKFGPLEWLWRCLTNMKFVSNRKVKAKTFDVDLVQS